MLEEAIVQAAIDELREVGYAGMTMDSVAHRAGAGKVSIYRRWPSRAELAVEAAYRLVGEPVLPDEPSTLRADLFAVLAHLAQQMAGPAGEAARAVVASSLSEGHRSRTARLFRGASPRMVREVVDRAARRGEPVDPDPSTLRLRAPAALLQHHVLTHGAPVEESFLDALVDEIAVPLLRSHEVTRGRAEPPPS